MEDKKRILLIEDEAIIRELYEKVLTEAGYELSFAFDGESGIEKAGKGKYDLILLDIMLPKRTGLDVLKELKTVSKNKVPIYMLTNLGQESVMKEAYSLGADGYLLKAKFLPEQLVQEIKAVFGRSVAQD